MVKTVVGDAFRLSQCIINLIANSCKFTHEGVIEVKCWEGKHDGDMVQVHFSVRDTGIGMSLQTQKGLFTPFKQGDSSTTRLYGGTGLGLTITKQLIDMMKGNIFISSIEGHGSTFHFYVWLKLFKNTTHSYINSNTNPAEIIGMEYSKSLLILIVEDNSFNQTLLKKMIESIGCKCIIASDGMEAVEKVKQNTFDLIFMDIQMPNMDGLEATRIIRKNKHPSPVIIALTANVDVKTMNEVSESGMDDFLLKPTTVGVLRQIIGKYT